VAELRAHIDAAGIAEDRKGWLCGWSNGQLVIGEAEKADLLATNQGVQGKINGCDNGSRTIETQAAGTALSGASGAAASQIISILRCVSASRRRLNRAR